MIAPGVLAKPVARTQLLWIAADKNPTGGKYGLP